MLQLDSCGPDCTQHQLLNLIKTKELSHSVVQGYLENTDIENQTLHFNLTKQRQESLWGDGQFQTLWRHMIAHLLSEFKLIRTYQSY